MSLVGAFVTWSASEFGARASAFDGRHLQELTEIERIESQHGAIVAADVALFARYTSYLRAWQLLTYQVEELEEGSDAARSLVFEAHGQLALARSLRPFFRAWLAPWRSADGAIEEDVAYDRDAALANLRQNEPRLGELLRSATDVQAAVARTKSIGLVVVLILFVGSLCLLTLAQLARSHARLPSAVLGTTIALIAGWFTIIVLSVPE